MRRLLVIGMSALLFLAASDASSSEPEYRLAGIVTLEFGSLAMIETPDGEQWLVRTGELAGEAQVLDIAADSVLLGFGDRDERLQLTGAKVGLVTLYDKGVPADNLRQMIEAATDLGDTADLPGLYDMQFLSEDARAVAINGVLIESTEQALTTVRKAVRARKAIRIILSEGSVVPVIYLNSPDSHEAAAD